MGDGADGYLVVGRNERPLPELYVLRPFLPAVTGHRAHGDGWQVWELGADAAVTDSVTLLVDITAATGAPSLLGSVLDAGYAAVEGFSAAGGYWETPVPVGSADPHAVEEVARRAARWAAAARHEVPADPIAEFLRRPPCTRPEGLLDELLRLLGLPGTAQTRDQGAPEPKTAAATGNGAPRSRRPG